MLRLDAETRRRVLVTPEELDAMMKGARPPLVVAVQSVNIYSGVDSRDEGVFIPRAVEADVFADFADPADPELGDRPLPSVARLQTVARRLGITAERTVVLYDADRSMTAARAWWVLKWGGVPDVRVLDGGLVAWRKAWLPVSENSAEPEPSEIELSGGALRRFGAEDAVALAREGILLDARIRPNYIGGAIEGDPKRGHIPGAVNAPAHDALTDYGTFSDSVTLAELYRGLGVDGTRTVGVYCGAGMSAAHSVLGLAAIGIDAALYPGSWSQWVHDPARPVKRGPFP